VRDDDAIDYAGGHWYLLVCWLQNVTKVGMVT